MSLIFQSLASGSSGNCLLLRTGNTTLLIDAGFSSMRACRDLLGGMLPEIDGVLISHLHSDHVSYSALRVLEEARIPLHLYQDDVRLIPGKHFRHFPFFGLQIRPFTQAPFSIGDLTIQPFKVPHDGIRNTFGFELASPANGRKKKIVVATDFRDWRQLESRFTDADFIYVEANHDPELLRAHPNMRSHYHLSNGQCGRLLREVFARSRKLPGAIMLGHLSELRNRPHLAREAVLEAQEGGVLQGNTLHTAPRHEPSPPIRIG